MHDCMTICTDVCYSTTMDYYNCLLFKHFVYFFSCFVYYSLINKLIVQSVYKLEGKISCSSHSLCVYNNSVYACGCLCLWTHLILFEVSSNSPSFIISQSVTIFLKQGINTRNPSIPRVFKILKSETTILSISLLTFESILCPHTLTVYKLTLPGLNITVEMVQYMYMYMYVCTCTCTCMSCISLMVSLSFLPIKIRY